MKTLIYIGNKANNNSKANLSSIDVLGPLFMQIGFKVYSASSKKNIVFRLLDMLLVCFKHRKNANYVIIDTYSTLNFYYAFFVSQLCRVLKIPFIPILHGGNLPERIKKSPKLSKAIFHNAHVNIAPSLYIKSKFEAEGFKNIINISNSIELNNYKFKPRTLSKVNLLWVRSFSKIYNPTLAIDILSGLKERGIIASLCMVGPDSDGSLRKVQGYAKKMQVEVRFTGKLSKPEWIKLSEDYNIFINTTNFDNMPVSVIEAMALGLPIVSTNVGGMPYLIDNHNNGLLVPPNSSKVFVEAIQELIEQPLKRQQLIQNARLLAEKMDWKRIEKQWLKVLK
ncbi:glycosyltransferase family 4 protein [Algibacter amylolyticus]|uniref:Glycosyltransferase family 4 protein n=1 Tax=Algibacter amylolyticus TaxID=1608400 RepID=A0A5M7B538_9FLAO|nr:glycosyltransferase family 4 protein [Algibacter amylolyticus]KAA5822425.1 glycosyltransferase family 4 protein [Algibacter amylolyticus]MBB5269146.1 glycosyltransferase involved in cell wall biosynthesis [Algibacter amylolyticus]TSJ73575.1 glycosyltransferase family 4 protein [Algibacter amylolyticus]